jgi:hypothetical protein
MASIGDELEVVGEDRVVDEGSGSVDEVEGAVSTGMMRPIRSFLASSCSL